MFVNGRTSGDTSGQSEPLLSSFDEPPTTVSNIAHGADVAGIHAGTGCGDVGRHASNSSGSSGSRNGSTASAHQVLMAPNQSGVGGAQPNEHDPITTGAPLLIHYDEVRSLARESVCMCPLFTRTPRGVCSVIASTTTTIDKHLKRGSLVDVLIRFARQLFRRVFSFFFFLGLFVCVPFFY